MIEIDVPGWRRLQLANLVLDLNGTLAVDGHLLPVHASVGELRQRLNVCLLSADTHGTLDEVAATPTSKYYSNAGIIYNPNNGASSKYYRANGDMVRFLTGGGSYILQAGGTTSPIIQPYYYGSTLGNDPSLGVTSFFTAFLLPSTTF